MGLNILLAYILVFYRQLSVIYSIVIIIYGFYRILTKNNSDGSAHIMAAYIVGIEVLFRMCSGGFGYEYSKYAAMVLLITGLLVEKRRKIFPILYLIFILLLLPSIIFIDPPTFDWVRQAISFNLSGPFMLGISAIYFYKRKLSPVQLRKIFLSIIYPITAMSVYLYFRSGSLDEIRFTTESNFRASGGFGPNQVSTIFGLGILIIAAAYFLNIRLFRIKYLNIILLLVFMVRGLATFSRGGILAPLVAIILCIIIMTLTDPRFKLRMNRIVYIFLVIFVVSFLGFNYVNDVSGGLLEKRYKGESMYDPEKEKSLLSGRDEIFMADLQVFENNPIGVGPGMAVESTGVTAHVEYSRLLAEHGILGLIAILILIFYPIKIFFNSKSTDNKVLLILCVAWVFVSLGHAAMRTAAPGFIYGLAFLNIIRTRE